LYGIEIFCDVGEETVISVAGIVHEEVNLAIRAEFHRSFDEPLNARLGHDISMDQDGFATSCLYVLDDRCSGRTTLL